MPVSPTRKRERSRSRRAILPAAAGLLLASGRPARAMRAAGTPVAATPVMATPLAGAATVSGTITFPADLPPGAAATIYVRVADVSRMDVPSVLVASQTLRDVPIPPPVGEPVTFTIQVASYDPRLTYAVRVHVDRDGDGRVSAGDLVSTAHHPVLTRGAGNTVIVPVSVV